MDADANLVEQLALARDILKYYDQPQRHSVSEHDAAKLASLVLSMDEWLRGGGFLPAPWQLGQRKG